jgi:hypothetical protein
MSIPLLKDMPAGREFIDNCVAAAAALSLAFVGTPVEQMDAALGQTRANLTRDLTPELGVEIAGRIADAFVRAVIAQRAEIEGNAGAHNLSSN